MATSFFSPVFAIATFAMLAWPVQLPGAEPEPVPATPPKSIRDLAETDKRMPANHTGGWTLQVASPSDPNLPRVLLIGDSILSGYRGQVAKSLAGKANVDAWITPVNQANSQVTTMFKEVIATAPYAVIHFNLGLHGVQKGRIPEGQYIPLTSKLVEQIRESAPTATLIWASTTPWMVKGEARVDDTRNPTVIEHNAMAAQVMQRYGIVINDLYGLMIQHLDLQANDLHWKPEAMTLQGKAVAACIETALNHQHPPGK